MPTPLTAKWLKPKSEDEFEDMVVDFVRLRWQDPNAQRYGRRGQRQHGVDIVGHASWLGGRAIAAQCKNVDTLTLADITAEVAKAVSFPGGLAELFIVTSSERDAALQSQVRAHFRASPAPFDVEVIFWPDIVADLSGDPVLAAKHWHGFQAQPSGQSSSFPSPRWIDRDGVKPNETTECSCELAVRLLESNQLDATELRAELQQAISTPPTDYVGRSLLEKQPVFAGGAFMWSDADREYDNVITKWAVQLGDGGQMIRRWSKFSTQSLVMLDSYDLVTHVVMPLIKYGQAIARWSAAVGGKKQPHQVLLRLALHATKPPQLEDRVRLIEEKPRFVTQTSPEDWQVELEADIATDAPRVAMRLLNRAFGRFVEQPSHWGGRNQQTQIVRIEESAYMDCLARFKLV